MQGSLAPVRRVVTGQDARGRSVIAHDGPSPNVLTTGPGSGLTDLWVTEKTPADNSRPGDPAARPVVLEPPQGGTIFRVVEFPPDSERWRHASPADRRAVFAKMGAAHALVEDNPRHPGMHKTDTVDYAVVVSGEIWAVMDEGETLLRAGDCLVQRGTGHAWSNRSDRPCRVAFVLVGARPLGRP